MHLLSTVWWKAMDNLLHRGCIPNVDVVLQSVGLPEVHGRANKSICIGQVGGRIYLD